MQTPKILYILLSLSLFSTGCQTFPKNGSKSNSTSQQVTNYNNTPSSPRLNSLPKEYRINPLDLIEISVYQEPDLDKAIRVSQDGYISFPLIGKVKVDGLTIIEAEKTLADLLGKDYLVDPQVNVFVKEYNSKKVV